MIEQISKFADILDTSSTGSPHKIKFSLRHAPSSFEFILAGDRLLYNKNIKLFHKILKDLLFGNFDISSSSIGALPSEPILFFDVHQFVWESVNRIHDEDIFLLFKDIDSMTVTKTKHPIKDFSLFSQDSVDSIVVFYFQVKAKSANLFLQDFETTNCIHYFRSLLRMSLLGYVTLERLKIPSVRSNEEPTIAWESFDKKIEEPTKKEEMEIQPSDKAKIFPFEPEIKRVQESKGDGIPTTPIIPLPTELKKDGGTAANKTKIENLKKILRNIKQL